MALPSKLKNKAYGKSQFDNVSENGTGFALSLLKNAVLVSFLVSAKYAKNAASIDFYIEHRGHT